MYLLDTSTLVDILSGIQTVGEHLDGLAPEADTYASVISHGELLVGAYGDSRYRDLEIVKIAALLDTMKAVLPVDLDVIHRYGELQAKLAKVGRRLSINDGWIAATALAHSLTLVTGDRHFERVPGLSVENWKE